MKFSFKCILALSLLSLSDLALAQTKPQQSETRPDEQADFFSFTLKELSKVRISVVSNRQETIREAPAIVSRLDRTEMERMGLRTLKDIISFFPGFVVNTDPAGVNPVMIRGLFDPENQKILFLLDGTPYWMPASGEIPLFGIPLSAIASVEVIRGPGGVFYGTNASAGVIKVVTRKDSQSEVSMFLGRNDLAVASGYGHFQLPQGELTLAVERRNDSGYQAAARNFYDLGNVRTDPFILRFDQNGHIKRAQEHQSGLLKYQLGGFGFTAQAFQSTDSGATNGWLESPHVREETSQLLTSEYQFEQGSWQYRVYGDVNRYYYHTDVTNFVTAQSHRNSLNPPIEGDGVLTFENNAHDNYRLKTGVSASGQVFEQLRLDLGMENELRSSERYIATDNDNGSLYMSIYDKPATIFYNDAKVREISTYAQLDYQQDNWRMTLGARYTDNGDYGSKVTPKAAMIYQLDQQQSLKLLYSEGFNSPTLAQNREISEFGEPTTDALNAEDIQSTDMAYSWSDSNHNFVANIFHIEASDLILRGPRGGYFNADTIINRQGIEFDYKYVNRHWQLFASAHYLKQGNTVIDNDPSARLTPTVTASLGVQYQHGPHQFGLSERFIGNRADIDSYHLLNLSYNRQIGSFKLFVDVTNLLDESAFQHNSRFLDFPLQMASEQGRSLKIGFNYQFD